MLKRRDILLAWSSLGLAACGSIPAPSATPRPPAPNLTGPLDAESLAWLNRLTWGLNEASAAECQSLGLKRWLDHQLQDKAPPPRLPAEVQSRLDGLTIQQLDMATLARRLEAQRRAADAQTDPEARGKAKQAFQNEMARLAREASQRLLLRAVHSPRQLQSRMGWFWLNHFSVYQRKAGLQVLVGDYEERLHAQALGRFRDLLGTVTYHPAMLRFLDNDQNAAGRVNENLGRELLELHTLGVDGGYSQADVQELSRVLTGLGVTFGEQAPRLAPDREALYERRGLTEFNPQRHDPGPKTVLGVVVKGQGWAEIDGVLDRLARHPATAHHVCRKMARYLVSDHPPDDLIEAMAQRFLVTDGRISDVLRTLFEHPAFKSSLGHQFKDPTHWVLSAVRQGLPLAGLINTSPMQAWLQRLGQAPFHRQTPDGYPLETAAWTAPGQLNTRFELARQMAAGVPALYRDDSDTGTPPAPPAPPQWQGALWRSSLAPNLSPATRQAMAQASANPRDQGALWLSSPDFMQH